MMELLLILWSLFVTIFLMVCAWRAMCAHEHIAEALTAYIQKKN